MLGIPTTLIGQSVASVFYPRINEAIHNREDPHRLLIKATGSLAVVGLIPFGLVVALGPGCSAWYSAPSGIRQASMPSGWRCGLTSAS
ncbi:hypothetical protein [Halomonas sp. E19]|uniref:hypothetical protein n=1 Tax=Halomonas sp. E19 TaxID=3397247 RepID=UPI004034AEC5